MSSTYNKVTGDCIWKYVLYLPQKIKDQNLNLEHLSQKQLTYAAYS